MVAVVTILRVLECRSGGNKLSNVKSFIILRSGEDVTSFTKGNSANFSVKNGKMKLSGESIFLEYAKKLKLNPVLAVVLVLEFNGLYYRIQRLASQIHAIPSIHCSLQLQRSFCHTCLV